jgi:hypothetical protein
MDRPDWITPGTAVLCYSSGNEINSIMLTRIGRVAAQSFVLEDASEGRFRIAEKPSRWRGGTWGHTRYVIPLDSDAARELLRRQKCAREREAAVSACLRYARGVRTTEKRLAAIAALQAVTEDEQERS